MKKILTFLMMFVTTAGILSAQVQVPQLPSNEPNGSQDHSDAPDYEESDGPTLNYQFVVRDESNNLVVDQDVNVEVRIESTGATADDVYPYFENFEALHTNHNGMLSLTLGGEGRDGSLTAVNWATARVYITVTETNGNRLIMQFEEPVYAVPYALQSSFLLTTPQIVAYVAEWSGHGEEDVDAIVAALRGNEPFLNTLRDTVVEYVKNHIEISKRVIRYYMHKVSGDDVRELYDHVMALDENVKKEIVNCAKDYLKRHRALALDLAKYYLRTTNAAEIDALYAKLVANEPIYQFASAKVDAVLDDYLRTIGLDPQCLATYHFDNICDLQAAAANMSNDPSDTCPRITSFTNTSNDGLVALALNGGIIMTAYVKNYSENKVTAYGIGLHEEGESTYQDRPVHYIPLTGNFGKIVDTMNLTQYCRDHLYSRAYLTVNQNECPASVEKFDQYDVPGYRLAIQKDGNKLKAVFTPVEAQQFFTSQRPNNVDWYVDGEQQPRAHGMEFTLPDTYTTITAKAHLRECRDEATYPNN